MTNSFGSHEEPVKGAWESEIQRDIACVRQRERARDGWIQGGKALMSDPYTVHLELRENDKRGITSSPHFTLNTFIKALSICECLKIGPLTGPYISSYHTAPHHCAHITWLNFLYLHIPTTHSCHFSPSPFLIRLQSAAAGTRMRMHTCIICDVIPLVHYFLTVWSFNKKGIIRGNHKRGYTWKSLTRCARGQQYCCTVVEDKSNLYKPFLEASWLLYSNIYMRAVYRASTSHSAGSETLPRGQERDTCVLI